MSVLRRSLLLMQRCGPGMWLSCIFEGIRPRNNILPFCTGCNKRCLSVASCFFYLQRIAREACSRETEGKKEEAGFYKIETSESKAAADNSRKKK
jgi:hypothetical protein